MPATFFLTGKWVQRYPDVTRRIAGNPRFELANHTYGHAAFTADCYDLPRLPVDELAGDVAKTFEVIEPYGGRQTRYFRFPGLCHDAAALDALAPLGVTVVDGDVVSGDPFATAWKPLVRAVLDDVRPGSVVIMHVTEANAAMTDEALPHILAGLRERGLGAGAVVGGAGRRLRRRAPGVGGCPRRSAFPHVVDGQDDLAAAGSVLGRAVCVGRLLEGEGRLDRHREPALGEQLGCGGQAVAAVGFAGQLPHGQADAVRGAR